MADNDQLYQEANEDLSDKVLDFGTGLAAAAGAAVSFYRAGGVRSLAKTIDKFERSELHDTLRTLTSLDYDHLSYDTLKKASKDIQDDFKKFRQMKDEDQHYIRLGGRRGTLGNYISKILNLEGKDSITRESLYQDRVVTKLRNMAQQQLNMALKALPQSQHLSQEAMQHAHAEIQNFVDEVTHKARAAQLPTAAVQEMLRRYDKTGKFHNVYTDVLKAAQAETKAFNGDKQIQAILKRARKKHGGSVEEQIIHYMKNLDVMERLGKPKTAKYVDQMLGDKAMTVEYALNHPEKFVQAVGPTHAKNGHAAQDDPILEFLRKYNDELKKKNDKTALARFNALVIDPYIRVNDKDEVYSLQSIQRIKHNAIKTLAETMPGKIFKLRDLDMSEEVPAFFRIKKGTINAVLSATEKGNNTHRVRNDYYYIAGNVYESKNGEFIEKPLEGFENVTAYSTRFGGMANLTHDMFGMGAQRARDDKSFWKIFDLNASVEENFWEKGRAFMKMERDNNYMLNVIGDLQHGTYNLFGNVDAIDRYNNLVDIQEMMNLRTRGLGYNTLLALEKNISPNSTEALELLDILKTSDNEQMLDKFKGYALSLGGLDKSYLSYDLNQLAGRLSRDEDATRGRVKLVDDITNMYGSQGGGGLGFFEQLRYGISQELLLKLAKDEQKASGSSEFTALKTITDNLDISDSEINSAKRLSYTALLNSKFVGMFTREGRQDLYQISDQDFSVAVNQFEALIAGKYKDTGKQEASSIITEMAQEANDPALFHTKPRERDLDVPAEYSQSDFGIMRKSAGPMELIRSINEGIQNQSLNPVKDWAQDFWKQIKAGGQDASNVSVMTTIPYFFLRRLGGNDLPPFLRFSNEALQSSWGITKALAKRIAPLAIGATELEWADDTWGAVTGTRASASFVNGLDYFDIGARKILDTVGIGDFINNESYINPIMQYWGGKDGYYNADQERDYYANGYEEVRRGRFWSFGSVNEFRGSQIEYYRPNLTRRLNSDYYNKSLYNGYWDKWSHSLLPTPIAPFSPLIYAMDPYYLEEEHYYDRPYPVTGTMFAKDTPWGIVLNPTIGELIKSVKRMHQEDMDNDGFDVKSIIYGINKHIRDTAASDHAYAIVFDREQITAGEYTGYTNPSLGQYNIRIGKTTGEAMRQKQLDALGGPMELERRSYLYSGGGGDGSGYGGDTLGAAGVNIGGLGRYGNGTGGGGMSPMDLLGQTNRRIYIAATQNDNKGGIITTDYIHHSTLEDILERDDVDDLIRAGQGGDLVHEMATSFRLLSGIYGYGANRAVGFGESDGKQIADSGDIDSFSRSFWDMSLGSIGGSAAEIGRRFVPEYRRNIRVNPLKNTMPDWLPESLQFGDPYAKLPYGEARLPGKGYEALNNLHPDQYGIYGSFDRFKILADVAPNSTEYKVWKKIAATEAKDPALQQEMQKIQKRVNEQSKTHDFYPYQIIGRGVEYQDAIVTEVNNDGTFRIKGSNQLYTMAGIDFAQKHTSPNDYQKKAANQVNGKAAMNEVLHPGQSVTLALDSNPYYQTNPDADHTINAAVFVDGESVAQQLLEEHPEVVQRKTDNLNAADTYAMTTTFQRVLGGAAELIAHMDLPLVHDRWLRVRDPMESYKAEQLYGTPYQTWSDIWGTFVEPAAIRAISNPWDVLRGTAEYMAINKFKNVPGRGKWAARGLSAAALLMDRGAFMGGMMAGIINPKGTWIDKGGKIGAAFALAGALYTSTQTSPFAAAATYGSIGWMAADMLDKGKLDYKRKVAAAAKKAAQTVLQTGQQNLNQMNDTLGKKAEKAIKAFFRDDASFARRIKGAAAGAAVGVAAAGAIGSSALGDRDIWIPDRVRQKWEMEDYFDRLTYIKYMGLYHKAAEKAKSEEGTDMEKIFRDYDEWTKKREDIIKESDINSQDLWIQTKQRFRNDLIYLKRRMFGEDPNQNHRFEYLNGLSINDLPGIRNGVFHSEELTEEERLYTLNTLVTLGIRYKKPGTGRTQDDRDMTQLTNFEHIYGIKIPEYYQVHHMVEFAENGPDDPSNMIALNPDDHLYITEQQHKLAEGDWQASEIGARTAMRLGEYGRAALLYKKAAESTMYGLRANARWTDVVRALPRYERDYFVEFMKERDPDKQKEILRSVSPFLRRALKQVWGMDYEDEKGPSNEEYFQHHTLPGFMWEGWDPDSDLNKVKAKVIKNEGMQFSDFGIFESTYRDQEVINAPNIRPNGSANAIEVQTSLAATLNGLGLTGVDVSVEPSYTKGVQSVVNLTKVVNYKVKESVNELFGA